MLKYLRNYLAFASLVLVATCCKNREENFSAKTKIPDPAIVEIDSTAQTAYPQPVLSADGNYEYASLRDLLKAYEISPEAISATDSVKGYQFLHYAGIALKRGNKWTVIGQNIDLEDPAAPISVKFAQLNGTGKPEMIVVYEGGPTPGRLFTDNWKELVIYDLENAETLFNVRIETGTKFYGEYESESFVCTRKVSYRDKFITVPDFKCTDKSKQKEYNTEVISAEIASFPPSGTYRFVNGEFEKSE